MAGEIKTLQFADGVETGEPSSLPLGPLDSHSDVDTTGANNGDALVYDASESKWKPGQGSGSGLGAVNFNTNPNATAGVDLDDANDIGDYVASGTGVTVAQATTGLPMGSLRTTGIQLTLAAGTADYVRLRFRVPETYRGMINQIAWRQALDSFVSGTAKVELYSYSDAYANGETAVNLLYRDSNDESLIREAPEFYEEFLADATREYYELRIVNDGATAGTLTLNDVVIGPDTRIMGAVKSDFESFTIIATQTTNLTYVSQKRQNASDMDVFVRADISGAINNGAHRFTLPDSLTADTDVLGTTPSDSSLVEVGRGSLFDASESKPYPLYVMLRATTGIELWTEVSGALVKVDLDASAVPFQAASGDYFNFSFTVPILEWRGKGTTQMLSQGRLYANARVIASTNTAGSYASSDTIVYEDVEVDKTGAYDSGVFTCQADGEYSVLAKARINGTTTSLSGLVVKKNGTIVGRQLYPAGSNPSLGFSDSFPCAAGDTLEVALVHGEGSNQSLNTDASYNRLSISRISDYTHGTGVGLGPATATNPGLVGTGNITNAHIASDAAIAGSKLQAATGSNAGAVTTAAQTWAGTKTVEAIRSGSSSTTVSSGSPTSNIFTPIVGQQYIAFAMYHGGSGASYHAVALVGNVTSNGNVIIHHLSSSTLAFADNSGSVRLESSSSSTTTVRITWIRLA